MKMIARPWPLLALALCSCAPSAHRFAGLPAPPAASGAQTFAMAQDGQPSDIVRKTLVDSGFEERKDGALRVEVGFAVRPRKLALAAPVEGASAAVISPAGASALTFCRRQAYVLSIAMVDHGTGKVRWRGGATLSRCTGDAATVLPLLARTAIATSS